MTPLPSGSASARITADAIERFQVRETIAAALATPVTSGIENGVLGGPDAADRMFTALTGVDGSAARQRIEGWQRTAAFRAEHLQRLAHRTPAGWRDFDEALGLTLMGDFRPPRAAARERLERAGARYDRYAMRLGEIGVLPDAPTALAWLIREAEHLAADCKGASPQSAAFFAAPLDHASKMLRERWRVENPDQHAGRRDRRRARRVTRFVEHYTARDIHLFRARPPVAPLALLLNDSSDGGSRRDLLQRWLEETLAHCLATGQEPADTIEELHATLTLAGDDEPPAGWRCAAELERLVDAYAPVAARLSATNWPTSTHVGGAPR